MGRWLKQTDTLIIMSLAVGLFLFRFGDETWAAVSPHLLRAQTTLSAQVDRVTTSLTSLPASVQADEVPATAAVGTSPVSTLPTVPFSASQPPARVVVGPSCGYGHGYGCQY